MRARAAAQALNICSRCGVNKEQILHRVQVAGCAGVWEMQQLDNRATSLSQPIRQTHAAQTALQRCYSVISIASQRQGCRMQQTADVTLQSSSSLQWQCHRLFSEDLRIVKSEITEHEYHHLADELLEHLQEKLEEFIEDLGVDGGDVEHAQGVLTVRLGSHGTYVINKQTPNKQIWLSSPVSGPFRYDYHEGRWVYHRDGRELLAQLELELAGLLGSAPDLVHQ